MRRPLSAIPPEPEAVWSRAETLALVALYLGVRAAFLIGNPSYFYNSIDAYLGAAASDFLRGDALPLLDYQYNNYNPATWVFTALAVPFVRLGGPFHQSVNALLLLVHAAVFSGWLIFGQRYVGRAATRWAALLWAAAPPFLLWMSMALKGGHHFMIVTQLFALACLIELRRAPPTDRPRELRLLFLLGVSVGLGCWWSLMFWTAAPVIGLLLLLESGRRLRLAGLAVLASAFLLGYAPAIYYNWTRDLQGFAVQEAPFWSWFLDAPREAPGRLWTLLTRELPESYRFASLTLGRLYAGATLAAWAYLVWRHRAELRLLSPLRILRRRPAPPFSPALYLAGLYAAFFLALSLSSFAREPDYFATPHIQGAILLGLAFAALAARGREAAAAAGRWAILGASAASIAIAFVQAAPAHGPALDGLSDGKYGFWLGYRYVKDPDFVFARISAFPASRRPNLYKGAGYGMSWLMLSTPPRPSQMTEMMAIAERVPTEHRGHFLDGLAVELAGGVSGEKDGVRALERVFWSTRRLTAAEAREVATAVIRDETDFSSDGKGESEREAMASVLEAAPQDLRSAVRRRYAWRRAKAHMAQSYAIGDIVDFAPDAAGVRAYLAEFERAGPEMREQALRQLGASLALGATGEVIKPASDEEWEAAREGAGDDFYYVLAGYAEGAVLAYGDEVRLPSGELRRSLRYGTLALSSTAREVISEEFGALIRGSGPPPTGVSSVALDTARERLRELMPNVYVVRP